jgi:sulfur carrier protein
VIIYVNGERRDMTSPVRLSDLLAATGHGGGRGIAVAVDGVVVPRVRHAETDVPEGARVEIVTAVQGG